MSARARAALLIGVLATGLLLGPAHAGESVRVLLGEGKPALALASSGGLTITDSTGRRTVLQRADASPVRLQAHRHSVLVREAGQSLPLLLAWPGRHPTVAVDGQAYRGRLEIHAINGGLTAINVVDLEDYLPGVLKDEIPPAWPAEAAKAVAIAARSYALFRMQQTAGALFHVRATTASQVYGGASGEDARTTWAAQATAGQVLRFAREPFPAFYHSCSGGTTEDGPDVFGLNFDMLVGVKDSFSLACPHALWVERLGLPAIERALTLAGYPVQGVREIAPLLRSRTGRVLRLGIDHAAGRLVVEGKRFREAIGTEIIRSTDFEVRGEREAVTFVGRGWGHGVGLSQWGAKEMAELAYQHPDILKFYYPLAHLSTPKQD